MCIRDSYNKGFKRKTEPFFGQVDLLETYKKYAKPNGLLRKLRAKTCELCGAICDDLEIHQVKRLKGLTGNTAWEAVMLSRHRKTLAVCPDVYKRQVAFRQRRTLLSYVLPGIA